jgi:polysaccharide export outer membrane protein
MSRKIIFLFVLAVALMTSCKVPQISYFQDANGGAELFLKEDGAVKLRPGDKVSVIVNTKSQEYNNLYNLAYVPSRIGQSASYTAQSQGIACYTVDSNGDIDFPVLGKIKAEGLTREALAAAVKKAMYDNNQVAPDDPLVVTVEYANLNISVLGEVSKPGRYAIDRDNITLLDALGMAGDLTIYGQRGDVLVMRQVDGKHKVYEVDLTSVEKLVNSPVYFMQQNDVIYVKPNSMRQRQATVSGNTVYTPTFWISVASLLTTITALIIK